MGSCFSSTVEPPVRTQPQQYYPETHKQVYAEPVYQQPAVMYQQPVMYQQQPVLYQQAVMYQQPVMYQQQQPAMYQQQPVVYQQHPALYQQQPQMSAGTAFVGGMLAGAVLEDILD
jgi:hypothetical protein